MMVLFTSRSEKKARTTVRRILDAFADRIGNDTWQTVITAQGLQMVKLLLRKYATKNTAVACHWIRSRSRSDVVWIVGDRDKFNSAGLVPVNATRKNLQHLEWENDWLYLPHIKVLSAMTALLHDWGKANDFFQNKLEKQEKIADPFRHEWLSCELIAALVAVAGSEKKDTGWLSMLASWDFSEEAVIAAVQRRPLKNLAELPPLAGLLCWLILSHHHLPQLCKEKRQGFAGEEMPSFQAMLHVITAHWGYENDAMKEKVSFSQGILKDAAVWAKQIKKWTARMLALQDDLQKLLASEALRPVISYVRECIVLSDHYVSSNETAKGNWQTRLYANTAKGELNQKLDEHLVRVADQALKIAQRLPSFAQKMERAYDIRELKKRSPHQFAWQDKAVEGIKECHEQQRAGKEADCNWFVVNMASTGCGKTFANAKIMQALSEDGKSLRYMLALGLRSLTLQTGDEYRSRIHLTRDEMAVLIGSTAVRTLHEKDQEEANKQFAGANPDLADADIQETLLEGELDYSDTYIDNFLDIFFDGRKNKNAPKNKAFLYKPVLVATIDHMMPAVEATKGGRHLLPFLRLMSSDLVIDEIDDFDKNDLLAISRLIHLAGMLGRNVVLSSATIPPDLVKGLFRAYQEGRKNYRAFSQTMGGTACVWCDEFKTKAAVIKENDAVTASNQFESFHRHFVGQRVKKLQQQVVKRKAYVVDCTDILAQGDAVTTKQKERLYFDKIRETAQALHTAWGVIDEVSGKKISFGLIRIANIGPCVAAGLFLMNASWGKGYAPRIMIYHSRQTQVLRHEQEKYLDTVLKRKGQSLIKVKITDPVLRYHIDTAQEDNLLFIVVATPVEEIGRDHDFDWAIVEPSSYRSIIQLAGRILRHRELLVNIDKANIAVMQYNLRGLCNNGKPAFCKPGYENGRQYKLASHDLKDLLDERRMQQGIDAIPRIIEPEDRKQQGLVQLEHLVMHDFQDMSVLGPDAMHGWLKEYWWLTGLPQEFSRFRDSMPEVTLYYLYQRGKFDFYEIPDTGKDPVQCSNHYTINTLDIGEKARSRVWLERDYEASLQRLAVRLDPDTEEEKALETLSKTFGELTVPALPENQNRPKEYAYSDQTGLFVTQKRE
ncbi:MAG: type I-F CRISPR-associated helicase Cas3f [Megasphaera sp.]|jgi:CRISPR-associated endonuclease/helicase Cas3|nr:type I-F CRISPR-associated helicase Cas3f [Megasphaera sp.]